MSAGRSFVDDLLGALQDISRLRAAAILDKWQGTTVYIGIGKKSDRRIRAAQNMLNNGMPQNEIVAAIATRFQVAKRTAQRDLKAAKNVL